jgi:hypothetical protein
MPLATKSYSIPHRTFNGATVAAGIHIDLTVDRGFVIAQNTVYGVNSTLFTGFYLTDVQTSATTVNYYNNIVHYLPNSTDAGTNSATGSPTLNHDYNNWVKWPNGKNETLSGISRSAHEINADPLFTNAAGAEILL